MMRQQTESPTQCGSKKKPRESSIHHKQLNIVMIIYISHFVYRRVHNLFALTENCYVEFIRHGTHEGERRQVWRKIWLEGKNLLLPRMWFVCGCVVFVGGVVGEWSASERFSGMPITHAKETAQT